AARQGSIGAPVHARVRLEPLHRSDGGAVLRRRRRSVAPRRDGASVRGSVHAAVIRRAREPGCALRSARARMVRAHAGHARIPLTRHDSAAPRLHAEAIGRAHGAVVVARTDTTDDLADRTTPALVVDVALRVALSAVARERTAVERAVRLDAGAVLATLAR